jgi:hypothetical protein
VHLDDTCSVLRESLSGWAGAATTHHAQAASFLRLLLRHRSVRERLDLLELVRETDDFAARIPGDAPVCPPLLHHLDAPLLEGILEMLGEEDRWRAQESYEDQGEGESEGESEDEGQGEDEGQDEDEGDNSFDRGAAERAHKAEAIRSEDGVSGPSSRSFAANRFGLAAPLGAPSYARKEQERW